MGNSFDEGLRPAPPIQDGVFSYSDDGTQNNPSPFHDLLQEGHLKIGEGKWEGLKRWPAAAWT
jgi:hypothetical protein